MTPYILYTVLCFASGPDQNCYREKITAYESRDACRDAAWPLIFAKIHAMPMRVVTAGYQCEAKQ